MNEQVRRTTIGMATALPGQVRLAVGDVVDVGGLYIVEFVNASRARIVPMAKKHRVLKPETGANAGKVREFDEVASGGNISPNIDRELVRERRGEQGLKDFLASKSSRRAEQPTNSGAEDGNIMAKKAKKERKARGGLAANALADGEKSHGALGGIYGHSVTSVLRRLGKDGVSTSDAKAIMAGLKKDGKLDNAVADATVQIQVVAGRNGKTAGKKSQPVTYAEITKEQLTELKSYIPEPEPAAEKA